MRSLALAALLLVACSDDAPTLPAEFELVGTAGTLVASAGCDPGWIDLRFGADGSEFQCFTVRLERNTDLPGQSSAAPWQSGFGPCSDMDGALRCAWSGVTAEAWTIEPTEGGARVGHLRSSADCTASVDATIIDPGR